MQTYAGEHKGNIREYNPKIEKGCINIKYVEWFWSLIGSVGQILGCNVLWCYHEGSVKFYRRMKETSSLFWSLSSYWYADVYVSHAKWIYRLCSKVVNKLTSLNWWYSFKRPLHINHTVKTIQIMEALVGNKNMVKPALGLLSIRNTQD